MHNNTIFFAQQGSSNEIRVSDQDKWYVIRQVWEGSQILDTGIESSYATRDEALARVDELFGYLTPYEIAMGTDTAESTWRNKAARGELRGAIKKGKQWLIPRSAIADMEL
jgi:hypothetical protein